MTSSYLERPFPALVLHFARSMFRSAEDTEQEWSIAGLLGVLAVPGALLSLTLIDKYSSLLAWIRGQQAADALVTSMPDKYFFLVFSMAATGLVAILQWDRILPGRMDFLNLGPLPVSTGAVFRANLMAILLVAAVFAVVVNGASSILFPVIVTASQQMFSSFLSFAAIHAFCVAAASLFAFFACLAAMGVLMAALPHAWFRRVSLYARVAMVMALVALLATGFAVPGLLRAAPDGWVRYLPPVWFLALYQQLQGRAMPGLASAASMAMPALGVAFLAAMAAYGLGYRRFFMRLPEAAERSPLRAPFEWPMPAALLATPFQKSCYWFGMKTLLRRESHSILLGAFTGFGLVAAFQALMPGGDPIGRLEAPLMIAYALLCGTRLALDLPATLQANWIFRLALDPQRHEAAAVARQMAFTMLVLLVVIPTAAVAGVWRAAYVTALSSLLAEGMLSRYRRVPFTCPLPEFGSGVTVAFAVYLVGFFLFSWGGARLEHWAGAEPGRFAALGLGWLGAWVALYYWKKEAGERDLEFGESGEPALRLDA